MSNWLKRNKEALKKWAAAGNAAVVIGAVTQTLPVETLQNPKFIVGMVILQSLLPGIFTPAPKVAGDIVVPGTLPPTDPPPTPKVN